MGKETKKAHTRQKKTEVPRLSLAQPSGLRWMRRGDAEHVRNKTGGEEHVGGVFVVFVCGGIVLGMGRIDRAEKQKKCGIQKGEERTKKAQARHSVTNVEFLGEQRKGCTRQQFVRPTDRNCVNTILPTHSNVMRLGKRSSGHSAAATYEGGGAAMRSSERERRDVCVFSDGIVARCI
jgi:hypothetical protein